MKLSKCGQFLVGMVVAATASGLYAQTARVVEVGPRVVESEVDPSWNDSTSPEVTTREQPTFDPPLFDVPYGQEYPEFYYEEDPFQPTSVLSDTAYTDPLYDESIFADLNFEQALTDRAKTITAELSGMGRAPGYTATWYPKVDESRGGQIGIVRQSLYAGAPLWRSAGDMVLFTVGVKHTLYSTDVLLPDSGRAFPSELWGIDFGLRWMHEYDNGWTGMYSVKFGSASEKPFHSLDEMNVGFSGLLRVPVQGGRDAWLFSLLYSPVGTINFPLPGLAYSCNPSPEWSLSIGLPFSVVWRPTEDWMLNFYYVPIVNVRATIERRLPAGFTAHANFDWTNEAYLLTDRLDSTDRFMVYEKRVYGGLRWDFGRYGALDLSAGYAFDRYFGVGENQIGDLTDQVDLFSGSFIAGSLTVRF